MRAPSNRPRRVPSASALSPICEVDTRSKGDVQARPPRSARASSTFPSRYPRRRSRTRVAAARVDANRSRSTRRRRVGYVEAATPVPTNHSPSRRQTRTRVAFRASRSGAHPRANIRTRLRLLYGMARCRDRVSRLVADAELDRITNRTPYAISSIADSSANMPGHSPGRAHDRGRRYVERDQPVRGRARLWEAYIVRVASAVCSANSSMCRGKFE